MAVEPGTYVYPIARDGNKGLIEVEIAKTANLIQNILLPVLTRNMSSGLHYLIDSTNDNLNRGIVNDTRLTATSETRIDPPGGTDPGPSDVYQAFSTPSGAAANHAQYFFKMI